MNKVYDTIVKMIADRFNKTPDELSRDTHFINDLSADSLDQIELTMDIEEEFELPETPEETLMKIATIGDLVEYVENVLDR